MKQTATMRQWYMLGDCLCGLVFDHPRIPQGNFVRTSRIHSLDLEKGICETLNTTYTLGNPLNSAPPLPQENKKAMIKVSDLSLCLLDEWAAKANMEHPLVKQYFDINQPYSPSTNWGEGGPIIEREDIAFGYMTNTGYARAYIIRPGQTEETQSITHYGTSKLIAAMRCYVEKTFGPEVPG